MKRKYFIVAGCIIPTLLTACPSKTFIGGDLIFSEFYSPNIYSNSAVEIANVGKKELDLSKCLECIFFALVNLVNYWWKDNILSKITT